jgi:hypothetical protein
MSGLPVGVAIAEGLPWQQLRIVTPLGIRFRDIALEGPITTGLVVLVKPRDSYAPPIALTANPSGVFGFHGMPGLHDVEYPPFPEPALPSPPSALSFVVMVADRLARFLPAVFGIELPPPPVPSPPTFDIDPDPAPLLDAFLFTAPTRPVTCGLAAIRADLWDIETEQPAAHARVRVTVGDRSRPGVADERGRLLVLVPWPLLEQLRLGSPPGTAQPPPFEHAWPVSLEVWFRPGLPRPFEPDAVLSEPWTYVPGLKGILEHPDRVFIWPAPAGPPVLTWTGDITYDHELIVRTQTVSELWISRGTSPP